MVKSFSKAMVSKHGSAVKPMCYLVGAMSGHPDMNRDAFWYYEQLWEEQGYIVVNPTRFVINELDDDPAAGLFYARKADIVAALPGWDVSPGATLEIAAAVSAGIPVTYADPDGEDGTAMLPDRKGRAGILQALESFYLATDEVLK